MQKMNFRGYQVNYIDIDANPKLGFYFPFQILIPQNLNNEPELIYACNLPGDYSKNCESISDLIEFIKKSKDGKYGAIDKMMMHLCLEKGNPMIIPFVPRLTNFRPNFLGRDCLLNDFRLVGEDKHFAKEMYMYNNLDLQHKAMIDTAINVLREEQIGDFSKVVLCGYSEGSKFASHIALLHPEIVKAIVAGGTGGVMSMPISSYDGYEFIYPTGISGLKHFDFKEFSNIFFFYYMGDKDKSDSAIPYFLDYRYLDKDGNVQILKDECGNSTPLIDKDGNQVFTRDANGNYRAKFNLFSDSEVNAINKVLGTKIQDRFRKQEAIYKDLGLKATFIIYEGNHHTVFNNCDKLFSDVDNFMLDCKKNHKITL